MLNLINCPVFKFHICILIILPCYYRKSYTTSSTLSCPIQHSIEGKCALVVDGTSGVGHAFANELLKRNAAKVIITGLNIIKGTESANELNKIYGKKKVKYYQMNFSNPLEIKSNILSK
ncbi:short-chain dehydrogenase reductase 3a-like [Aphis craccivora]|uniref:Short-chain dehydrogenase reductase 3a-like n=1 Tax=Aphis craccivora TaxID=307492 RepID=A0A6G0VWA6_APHCR|nr:short-chain dehydrogenase reductase 3a-like [Aphis craccivora]